MNTKNVNTLGEFLKELRDISKRNATLKECSKEEIAFNIGIYHTAATIWCILKDNSTKYAFTTDYAQAKKMFKQVIDKEKKAAKEYKQLSFDDVYPEIMKTLDRVNKYLDDKEKQD